MDSFRLYLNKLSIKAQVPLQQEPNRIRYDLKWSKEDGPTKKFSLEMLI
jgi:hypothetical protein